MYMYLPYLPEASYIYSPANHCIVLKKYSLMKCSLCLGLFWGGGGMGGHFPSLFDASYGPA